MLIVDRDMRIVWMNAAASETGEEALGEPCFSALGMEAGDYGDCPAMRTFNSGTVERGVRMARSPDGQARYMDLVTAPLRDASGEIYQVLEVARDITDLVRMEERLKETNQALLEAQARLVENERLAAIGQVVVTLHHAILNPLTGILGALQILKADGISKEARQQALAGVETEVRRIERVVRNLPELPRAEGIPYVGQTTMLDIGEPGP